MITVRYDYDLIFSYLDLKFNLLNQSNTLHCFETNVLDKQEVQVIEKFEKNELPWKIAKTHFFFQKNRFV